MSLVTRLAGGGRLNDGPSTADGSRMALSAARLRRTGALRRATAFLAFSTLLVASCAGSEPEGPELTEGDVVLAYVDRGVSSEVAECLVGLGQREFDLDHLLPDVAADEDRLLIDEMLGSCENAVGLLNADDPPPPDEPPDGPDAYGDDPFLDRLWLRCARGDGRACDQLFVMAPVGSGYEQFGVSCGERSEILDCSVEMGSPPDLVLPDVS